jgi:hypothetical protein
MRVNWGTAIALVYAIFASGTVGFVAFALQHPVQLVSEDYYGESLAHDSKRAAIENAGQLPGTVLGLDGEDIVVSIPPAQRSDARGDLRLYRPSDVAADRGWALALDDDGRQRFGTQGLARGRWIAQLSWSSGGRRFYRELPVVVR